LISPHDAPQLLLEAARRLDLFDVDLARETKSQTHPAVGHSCGLISPTNQGYMTSGPTAAIGDQATDVHLLLAEAGFEPATSGF
jgi:hypothetical protein